MHKIWKYRKSSINPPVSNKVPLLELQFSKKFPPPFLSKTKTVHDEFGGKMYSSVGHLLLPTYAGVLTEQSLSHTYPSKATPPSQRLVLFNLANPLQFIIRFHL